MDKSGPYIRPIEKKRHRFHVGYFDYGMVLVVILLLAFGMVMLYSTSSYTASLRFGDAAFFVKRQAGFALVGLVLMYLISRIDYHIWPEFSFPVYILSIGLVCYALVNGSRYNNSSRWISVGPVSVQPSELVKVAVIILFASLFARLSDRLNDRKTVIKMFIIAVPGVVSVAISNLSTAVIIFLIFYGMLLIASRRWVSLLAIGIVGALFLGLFVTGYRKDRIEVWQHPEQYEKGYQSLQGLYAIGSGGVFGKGLGESMQKAFVPEAQNDMIFSIICEELGFFGAVCVLLLFLLLLWRLLFIATHAADQLGSFLAIGILIHIAIQVVLNVAVVTNTIPNTGVTLPFISYGGSALITLLGELGLALSVSRKIIFTA